MTRTAPTDGLPGRLLLRLARLLTSRTASERVFVPLLADFQFEYRRATSMAVRLRVRLKWTVAFGQALGLEAVLSSAVHLRTNAWGTTEEERCAARRLLALTAAAAIVCGLAASLYALMGRATRATLDGAGHWALILPSAFGVALPAGVLFGIVLSARELRRNHWRPLLGLASLVGLGTFILAAWITPTANHAYRERAFSRLVARTPHEGLPIVPSDQGRRGDREMTFGALGVRAREVREGNWGAVLAPPLEVEWHKKPALGASCLALALAGAAIVRRLHRWAYRWPAALLVLAGWFWLLRLGEQAADAGAMAPALAMWGPCFAVAALGLGALGLADLAQRRHREATREGPYEMSSIPGKK
jgi:hypothetical protein